MAAEALISALVMMPSSILSEVTALAPMVASPVLVMLISPVNATAAPWPEALPTII